MTAQIVVLILIMLGGLFAIFCAAKDYPFFMEHRKALMLTRIIGRTGTRIFYIILGLALFVVGLALLVKGEGFAVPIE